MPSEFTSRRRVAFSETDLAGIVHFANYFRYLEDAEHEFLRSLGLSVHARIDGRVIGWPRVRAECSFEAPLRFEDEFDVHLRVRRKSGKGITYEFRIEKCGGATVARGSMTVVCVAFDPATEHMSAIPIPTWIDEKIGVAEPEQAERSRHSPQSHRPG